MAELAQPWIQTPGFLQDRARKVHTGLLALNAVIDNVVKSGRLTPDNPRYKQWKQLLSDWGKWYGDTSGSTWWFNSADATLESYELTLKNWTNWVGQSFPETKASLPTPPDTFPPPTVPDVGGASTAFLIGAGLALGAVLLLSMRR